MSKIVELVLTSIKTGSLKRAYDKRQQEINETISKLEGDIINLARQAQVGDIIGVMKHNPDEYQYQFGVIIELEKHPISNRYSLQRIFWFKDSSVSWGWE